MTDMLHLGECIVVRVSDGTIDIRTPRNEQIVSIAPDEVEELAKLVTNDYKLDNKFVVPYEDLQEIFITTNRIINPVAVYSMDQLTWANNAIVECAAQARKIQDIVQKYI